VNDSEKLFLVDWIIKLRTFESHGIEGHQTSCFPRFAEGKNGTRAEITSVSSNINVVCGKQVKVYCCQTFAQYYQLLAVKGFLVVDCPRVEILIGIFCVQVRQHHCVVCKFRQEGSNIVQQTEKQASLHSSFRYRPRQNCVDLLCVGFNSLCGNLVPQEINLHLEQASLLFIDIETSVSQSIKYGANILFMLFDIWRPNYNVVKVNVAYLPNQGMQCLHYPMLVDRRPDRLSKRGC
jgi:hypothetical protein